MANHKKTQHPRKERHPLPKVGTPKDDEYRLSHSRHDVVDFGLTKSRGRLVNGIILACVAVVLLLGAIGLILFT